jgi:FkbM family methyltransferase
MHEGKLVIRKIKNQLNQFRRRVIPVSSSTAKKHHDAVISRIDRIDQRFAGLEFLLAVAPTKISSLLGALKHSRSQIWQDIFVLAELDAKRNGFFVEFGATNGIDLSNTYLLEKQYGWTGILAEPARYWQVSLRNNRNAFIETKCVWSKSDLTINFKETDKAEFSTIDSFTFCDQHRDIRKHSKNYLIETISLLDMLQKYNAPRVIDYLSIDTEGSEYEILEHFDFERYQFRLITCEHNFTESRARIHQLLISKGYERKFEHLSQWDDWYVGK